MSSAEQYVNGLFNLAGKVAVVTGATSGLGRAMALGLANAGVRTGILGRRKSMAQDVVTQIEANGGEALAVPADVLQRDQLESVKEKVLATWGQIDILVNAAGGNSPDAMVAPDGEFFNTSQVGMQQIIDLNLMGTILPCQVFGEVFARQKQGSIVNISSLSVPRALTRAIAYSASKAAVENFTRWLAVEMMNKYGANIRVNAITPGFFYHRPQPPIYGNRRSPPDPTRSGRFRSHTDETLWQSR